MNSTKRQLREFGLLVGGVLIGLFGIFFPWVLHKPHPVWPWWGGVPLLVLGAAFPWALRPLYGPWMKLSHVLGWVNSRILLSIIYFLVFTPVAFFLRLTHRRPLLFSSDAKSTIRVDRKAQKNWHEDMERPF